MRDSFDAGEFNGVNWIEGCKSLAGGLNKWNLERSERLNMVLYNGVWDAKINPGGCD